MIVSNWLGWGHTTYTGDPSTRLKKVEVAIVSQEECQAAYQDVHWKVSLQTIIVVKHVVAWFVTKVCIIK